MGLDPLGKGVLRVHTWELDPDEGRFDMICERVALWRLVLRVPFEWVDALLGVIQPEDALRYRDRDDPEKPVLARRVLTLSWWRSCTAKLLGWEPGWQLPADPIELHIDQQWFKEQPDYLQLVYDFD